MWSRRSVLAGLIASTGLATTSLAFAALPRQKRLCIVFLRGGLDALHTVIPHADPNYGRLRNDLAVPGPGEPDGALDLDGHFGLHPALAPLLPHWASRDLAIVQGAGTPFRTRSHFDAQEVIENGTDRPGGARDGWLNRALGEDLTAMAMGKQLPLLLRGPNAATSVDPLDPTHAAPAYLDRVEALYTADPVLAEALQRGRDTEAFVTSLLDPPGMARRGPAAQALAAAATGRLLADPQGPSVAVIELGGWDTHTRQKPALNSLLGALGAGLDRLAGALEPVWDDTVVMVITEFGRTARPNGTGGTDHGTGGVALLLGGAVNGGLHGVSPGLSDRALVEGRDLAVRVDLRSVFKGVLEAHLGLDRAHLEDVVFPNSRGIAPLWTLIG